MNLTNGCMVSNTDAWISASVHTDLSTLKEKEDNMKNLYHIIVIDLNEEILFNNYVIATNEEDAKFTSGVYNLLTTKGLNFDSVTEVVKRVHSGVKIKETDK